jgi:hypothetical protein
VLGESLTGRASAEIFLYRLCSARGKHFKENTRQYNTIKYDTILLIITVHLPLPMSNQINHGAIHHKANHTVHPSVYLFTSSSSAEKSLTEQIIASIRLLISSSSLEPLYNLCNRSYCPSASLSLTLHTAINHKTSHTVHLPLDLKQLPRTLM